MTPGDKSKRREYQEEDTTREQVSPAGMVPGGDGACGVGGVVGMEGVVVGVGLSDGRAEAAAGTQCGGGGCEEAWEYDGGVVVVRRRRRCMRVMAIMMMRERNGDESEQEDHDGW